MHTNKQREIEHRRTDLARDNGRTVHGGQRKSGGGSDRPEFQTGSVTNTDVGLFVERVRPFREWAGPSSVPGWTFYRPDYPSDTLHGPAIRKIDGDSPLRRRISEE